MATPNELDRLASMAAVLRPDWNRRSVRTLLSRPEISARPWQDIAVALAVVAGDPRTETPGRLTAHGPWWAAAYLGSATPPRTDGVPAPCPRHPGEPAGRCDWCAAESRPAPPDLRARAAAWRRSP